DAAFYEHAKQRLSERMHLADLFTRKLALIPFDLTNPIWVDDEDVDLDYHVRHVALPRPGTNRQLQQYVARLHSSLLDRSRPLVGVFHYQRAQSGQAALYTKAHHAGMDGQGGIAVAQSIFDMEPAGRVVKPPRPRVRSNRYQLGFAELAGAAARNMAAQVIQLAQGAPAMLGSIKGLLTPARDEDGKRRWGPPRDFKIFGPRTLLNVAITNQRTFAGRTISLAETKFIGKTLGGSLNDVVMATTAGALRNYLKDHSDLPQKPLLAAIPMSLRAPGDTTANNQVSGMIVSLATDEGDPVKRLRLVHESAEANKAMMSGMNTSMPTDFPLIAAPWLFSGIAAAASRSGLITAIPPLANLIISNVPGSPVPLYFAGAKLASFYPVSIAIHSMALNVTVQSYAGRLDYGLIACRRAMPDVTDLGDYLLSEHQALLAAAQKVAGVSAVAAPAPAPSSSAAPVAAKQKVAAKKVAAKKAAPVAKKASKPAAKKR
ncbi:MAG: wax ester/triacylglycerol synthase family O-acyltransferase, partial [Brachymonas sp.]|nr:wax ester/triacylglycerol synthase family O-acyltransferase [Brachymonas sp.]